MCPQVWQTRWNTPNKKTKMCVLFSFKINDNTDPVFSQPSVVTLNVEEEEKKREREKI